MKKLSYIIISLLLALSCSDEDYEIPQTGVEFITKDGPGLFDGLYNNGNIPSAEIFLQSVTKQNQFTLLTDEEGKIRITVFDPILPDEYYIQVNRELTPEEKKFLQLDENMDLAYVNKKTKKVEISGEKDLKLTIELEPAAGQSPLIISEIYASGPPDAGYYFHDKYIEIYNTTDTVMYLDGLLVASLRENAWGDTENYVYSKNLWMFPGEGNEYPIAPGEFVVCAEDGMDHTLEAEYSVDLSHAGFEFYKEVTGKDLDYENVPNMILIYQPTGFDWVIGGEKDAVVISNAPRESLFIENSMYAIPIASVLDGVEYLKRTTDMGEKRIPDNIDAGATGGIEFYTGKAMERKAIMKNDKFYLIDQNNSSVDFKVIDHPTPAYHHSR